MGQTSITSTRRILVVEDDRDTSEVLCLVLTMMGHVCRPVFTGRSALDEADAFNPDIALVDVGLPDLSGYELAPLLRASCSNGAALHIVAVTGWGRPEDIARMNAAGFDQHVLKPTDTAALKHLVAVADAAVAG